MEGRPRLIVIGRLRRSAVSQTVSLPQDLHFGDVLACLHDLAAVSRAISMSKDWKSLPNQDKALQGLLH